MQVKRALANEAWPDAPVWPGATGLASETRRANVILVVSIAGSELFAALPIREQPTYPPETGPAGAELAFFAAVLLALVIVAVAVVSRRGNRDPLALDENRARAAMEKLCRHGWSAQLTVYGSRAPLPEDAPEVEGVRVRLDWAELAEGEEGDRDVAVERRLWARSIPGALRSMVDDRRLDHELEEIERAHAGNEPSGEL
jgi:hypothetical protein